MKALQQVAIKDAGDQRAKFWDVETALSNGSRSYEGLDQARCMHSPSYTCFAQFYHQVYGGYIEVPENVLEQDVGQGDWADPEPELDFTVQNQVKEIVQDAYFDRFM